MSDDKYNKNCFFCSGMTINKLCYSPLHTDGICTGKITANKDLQKYELGDPTIALYDMFQDYLRHKAEQEDTRILSQEEVDDFRKELDNNKN